MYMYIIMRFMCMCRPENAPEYLYDAMCLCHKHEAKQRPSFTEILAMLQLTKEEEVEEEGEEEGRAHDNETSTLDH